MAQMDGWKPLAGLKVIDFSMLLPGPLTTLILRDLGAEVIKVEPPGGDYARHMNSHMFQGANRGKDSIALDLKAPGARPILEKLALYGDVVIEGFRPGVADRLGFGPDTLQALNPKLVYCSLSGFGQTGPAATHAGHDLAYLAMGGALAHRGQLRQSPSRAALPIADIAGGPLPQSQSLPPCVRSKAARRLAKGWTSAFMRQRFMPPRSASGLRPRHLRWITSTLPMTFSPAPTGARLP